MKPSDVKTEKHPFEPFLPEGARILFLGSFPPQEHRWCMPFCHPNWINPFTCVDTDTGITMEDCQNIDAKIGIHIVKTIFYLYVTSDDKPFVARDFRASMGRIPRVSFAPAQNFHLVMDAVISKADWFACTDGTPTCFVKIRTRDLLDKYLEGKKLAII